MKKMSEAQIQNALKDLPDWSEVSGEIQRTFQFANFLESMAFVNQVAQAAEADQHHPDILVRYNKVTLTLSTHDAAGITKADFALARKCDGFVPKPPQVTPTG